MLEEAAEGKDGLIPRMGIAALCLWGGAAILGYPVRRTLAKTKMSEVQATEGAVGEGTQQKSGEFSEGQTQGGRRMATGTEGASQSRGEGCSNQIKGLGPKKRPRTAEKYLFPFQSTPKAPATPAPRTYQRLVSKHD